MKAISETLRLTESIICTLVPGDEFYQDKKVFSWQLVTYEPDKIELEFDFTFPEYISNQATDTLQITFNNTSVWIAPKNGEFSAIPDGYTIVMPIP